MAQNTELSAILAKLSGNGLRYFPATLGDDAAFQLTGVSQRSYSTIYFFDLMGERNILDPKPSIAVKVYRDQVLAMNTPELQYRSLTSLWPKFRDDAELGLPQPLDYFSDLPALVMERVKGNSLQALFSKINILPSHRRTLASACMRTGRWLAKLHHATSLAPGKLDVKQKLADAKDNLVKLESMGFASELCGKSVQRLDLLAGQLSVEETPMALVHGDFTVDNIVVDGERIVALDLTGRDHNAIEHDLATFLNSLRLLRLTMPLSQSLLNRCSDAFLYGYFGFHSVSPPALHFLRVAGLLSTILEIAERRWGRVWTRIWAQRFFTRELGGLVRS